MQIYEETNNFTNLDDPLNTAIRIAVGKIYDVTEIKFYTYDQILTDLGGFAVVLKAFLFVIVIFFIKN